MFQLSWIRTNVPLDGPDSPYGGGGVNSQGIQQDLQGATNIGLDVIYKDQGVSEGRFKIPSLRNVALTAPYMHDGRFKTLEEGLTTILLVSKPNRALDVKFKDANGFPKQLGFTKTQKEALRRH